MDYVSSCGNTKIAISEQDLFEKTITRESQNAIHVLYNNKNFIFQIECISVEDKEVELKIIKRKKKVNIEDSLQQMIQSLGYNSLKSKYSDSLVAPMPGLVLDILVKEGDEVRKGDHLITLEAMKMENILKAPHDGKIKKLNVNKSEKVEKNQLLLLFDERA